MTEQHPITPPPELVGEWLCSEDYLSDASTFSSMTITSSRLQNVATRAARWGADTELEACAKEVSYWSSRNLAERLRDCRRPKPQSLKEQALLAIDTAVADGQLSPDVSNVVRRALEQLDD
jgi:hypothetical protein